MSEKNGGIEVATEKANAVVEETVRVMPNPRLDLDSVRFGEDEVYRKGDEATATRWEELKTEKDPVHGFQYLVKNEGGR